jgi:DNA invertase Pin-like site-specific DNA recombinase
MPNVTVIPATIDMHAKTPLDAPRKKRLAGYARVSSGSEEQESSFEAQVDYYTKKIQENPEWEFVGIYADEAVSGLGIKNRPGFQNMIADALDGKIDIILTKSVSRLSRNTADNLNAIRALKEKGVEIRFEKENINSLDGQGELLLTLMASLAQEEARSLSLNVTWGQRKRFADGKVSMPYARFLGYEKGPDGTPKVIESEAKIVREIYQLYLNGTTVREITRQLTARGIPTPGGKEVWAVSTIMSILQNVKYKGEAILQQKFTIDYLTKRSVKNEGQVPMYYVTDSHPGVVAPEIFDMVQAEIARNRGRGKARSNVSCFSDRIICGACGEVFGPKTWNSNDKYRRLVWQCNSKYRERGVSKCPTAHLTEEQIKKAFVDTYNQIIADRERYIAALDRVIGLLADTDSLNDEAQMLEERSAGIFPQLEAMVADNARRAQDQSEYNARYNELRARYDGVKQRLADIADEKKQRLISREKILAFAKILQQREGPLVDFNEHIWRSTVEQITVYSDSDVAVTFRDGKTMRCDVRMKRYAGK